MPTERKYVMSIAGFDPSGGAGILADMKTFEQHKVYGLSVNTANTIQTDRVFHSIQWASLEEVLATTDALLEAYPVQVIKTGIMPSFRFLHEIISFIKTRNPEIRIIVDPVVKSSSGFDFLGPVPDGALSTVLKKIYLLTPNVAEAQILGEDEDAETAAKKLSASCHVLLKGGHRVTSQGVDRLYFQQDCLTLQPDTTGSSPKHGSGCVFSAAIVANLALGDDLLTSCIKAKRYIEKFLSSNNSPLGYHHV